MSGDDRWLFLAQKFARGECSPEELAEFEGLQRTDSAVRRRITREGPLAQPGESANVSARVDTRAALARVKQALRFRTAHAARHREQPGAFFLFGAFSSGAFRRSRVPAALAASLLLVIGGGALWFREQRLVALHSSVVSERQFAAARGRRDSVEFPDGSRAVLAPETRLTYAASASGRFVTLSGEAYFEVRHDARHPFTVRASNAIVEDIGTHFVVRSYSTDRAVHVLVTEGSIALHAAGDAERRVMTPGTLGVVTAAGQTNVAPATDPDALLAWQDGQLVFHRTPLAQVVGDLSRWYDLDIHVADTALATYPVSGSLPTTTVNGALDAVANVTGARWERHGRTVTLFTAPRTHHHTPAVAAPR